MCSGDYQRVLLVRLFLSRSGLRLQRRQRSGAVFDFFRFSATSQLRLQSETPLASPEDTLSPPLHNARARIAHFRVRPKKRHHCISFSATPNRGL